MTAARFLAATTVVIVAALCTPAALVQGINSADLIVISAPIVLLLIVARPRRRERTQAFDVDVDHGGEISRLDRLDGLPRTPAGGTSPKPTSPHVDAPPAGTTTP